MVTAKCIQHKTKIACEQLTKVVYIVAIHQYLWNGKLNKAMISFLSYVTLNGTIKAYICF